MAHAISTCLNATCCASLSFFLCCDWLFKTLFRTVRLQIQSVLLGTNQIAGIASDFKMDMLTNVKRCV